MIHRCWAGVAALLLAGLLGAAPAGPVQGAVPGEEGDHYNTVELIQRTVKGLPQCLHYCLLGFEIRIRYTGYTVEVYLVPRVEHYLAALHVMTADRFPKEAYTEWAERVGEIQKRLLDALARTVPPGSAANRWWKAAAARPGRRSTVFIRPPTSRKPKSWAIRWRICPSCSIRTAT